MELSDKLRDCFDEMVVYKDLKKTNFFSALSLPAFMRDWLLKKFEDEDGEIDYKKLRPISYEPVKNEYVVMGESVGKAFSEGKKLK